MIIVTRKHTKTQIGTRKLIGKNKHSKINVRKFILDATKNILTFKIVTITKAWECFKQQRKRRVRRNFGSVFNIMTLPTANGKLLI